MASGDAGKRIGKMMEARSLTPKDLVEFSLGEGKPISYQRIGNWLSGDNDPKQNMLPLLARFLQVNVEEIIGVKPLSEVQMSKSRQPLRTIPAGEAEVPLLKPIRAGSTWTDPFGSDETILVPSFMVSDNTFVAPVEGDSMYPFLHEEDMCVYEAAKGKLNMVVVARNEDEEMTVKQFKHNGIEYILHPLNESYPDLRAREWRMEGYLVGLIRVMDGERLIRYNPRGLYPDKKINFFS